MSSTLHRRPLLALTGVALTLALAACSGGSSSSEGGSVLKGSSGGARNGPNESSPGDPTGSGLVESASAPRNNVLRLVLDTRKLIRTASLTVAVKDVNQAVRAASQAVQKTGGAVYSEQVDHDKKGATTATLTLKVVPSAYATVLDDLATSLGTEVARSQEVKDVTEDVVDVNARLDVQRRAIDRIKLLLDHATKLSDIITLEGDLSTREAAYESLQARQRTLAAQTDLATITLILQRKDLTIVAEALKPKSKAQHGFIGGLKSGWSAFRSSIVGLLTVVGALLPFAVLAALITFAVASWRRRRRLGLAAAHVVD